LIRLTPNQPGAIAILQLVGDIEPALAALTNHDDWPIGRMRLSNFAGIDEGIAIRLTGNVAQLMPHSGLRVIQKLTALLVERGVQIASAESLDPMLVYPEAEDQYEALMLAAVARAQSLLAIEALLDQPRRWRQFSVSGAPLTDEDRLRSQRLNRLIDPPLVVLAGRPNVGKSTLSNALIGRSMSIALDQPGTTRDYTAGQVDLAGLVVNWHDTPGIRCSDDPIERRAIDLARRLIERADLLISMTDAIVFDRGEGASVWPELPRPADVHVVNKCDLIDEDPRTPRLTSHQQPVDSPLAPSARKTEVATATAPLRMSARTGSGIVELVAAIRDHLVPPEDLAALRPWIFDDRLLPLAISRR
jgi:tRNA modification GTPase